MAPLEPNSSFTILLPLAFAACVLLYIVYLWALPKPIPGIPHNPEATRSIWGDIPSLFAYAAKTRKPPLAWLLEQSQNLRSPIIQVFIRPFAQPRIVLCDFREAQDILMRRKDFDRSLVMGDFFAGLVPYHHIHQPTNAVWKGNRRLLQDLMSPKFLHNVAGPVIHRNASNLMRLWRSKASLAEGRPFNASEDIYHAALDAVLAFSFGESFSHSATLPNVALLEGLGKSEAARWREVMAGADEPVIFPEASHDQAITATLDLATAIENIQGSVIPRWKWWFMENFTLIGRTVKVKNDYILQELKNAAERERNVDAIVSEARSAVDLMVHRETILADKEGREPNYLSPTLRDEAFGFVVAGHDTTSTTILWALKFLADTPSVQDRLRSDLQISLAAARAERRDPSIEEITSTHIPYLDATMEEILRCAGTVPGNDRQALCDTELLGYPIPKGTIVMMLGQGPSMRSPAFQIDEHLRSESSREGKTQGKDRAWNPDDIAYFKPERWLAPVPVPAEKQERETGDTYEFNASAGPQLAFGLGTRSCFGKRLAYLELRILLSLIVWNFRLVQCPPELSNYEQNAGITHKPRQCYVRLQEIEPVQF
ncbi:cytochrome P450 [Hypoxylon crocopeplum]|nr:cytochrome P450 [Hypoxylon crocopeplum]